MPLNRFPTTRRKALFQISATPALPGRSFEEETADRCCGRTTNKHEDRWTSFDATTSGDEAHPGARASRPHNFWHSLGHLLHPARPATAPGPCFSRAHAVPAGRVAGCRIAGKLSGKQRDSMRAGRPRSRVAPPPITLAPQGGTRRLARLHPMPMWQSRHA